jgi:hypothetical protein
MVVGAVDQETANAGGSGVAFILNMTDAAAAPFRARFSANSQHHFNRNAKAF